MRFEQGKKSKRKFAWDKFKLETYIKYFSQNSNTEES